MKHQPLGPTQRLYRSLLVMVALITLGLIASVVLVSIENARTNDRLARLEDFIEGRGEDRDRENQRTNQRINDAICDLLDQLPEGGLLDRPREKYQCGPGIPVELLTPEEQQRLGGSPAPSSPVPPVPVPPLGSPATPNVPRSAPNTPSPGNGLPAEPAPAADPLVDLAPITNPLCDALGICV